MEQIAANNRKNRFIKLLLMDTTTRCNISCIMCPVPKETDKYDMPVDLYSKISEEVFPHVQSVVFACDYEPLVSGIINHVLEDMRKYNGFSKSLFTNGMLIDKEMSVKLINSGLDKLIVSVHGAGKSMYEAISRGAKWKTFNLNIERFNRMKKRIGLNKPEVEFVMTVMKRNIKDIPGVVRLAKKHNVKKVCLRRVGGGEEESIVLSSVMLRKYFEKASELASLYNISLDFPAEFEVLIKAEKFQNNDLKKTVPRFCDANKGFIWINPAGLVKPCNCWQGDPIGDLKRQSFTDIWNNSKYKKIRQVVSPGRLNDNCRECYVYDVMFSEEALREGSRSERM